MNSPYEFQQDRVDESVFVARGAVILGDVEIGPDSTIWYNAVIRGDTAPIRIGTGTNIQDLCMLHADEGFPCTLGDGVTVGHSAIVHGATVEDGCMIGMRAVVMNGAVIGAGSLVAVGAVVLEGQEVPPGSVVMGVPARVRRELTERDQSRLKLAAEHYVEQGRRFKAAQESS